MSRVDAMMLALGWVLVIEGFMPMLAPGFWKKAVRRVSEELDASLRITGLLLVVFGLALVWIA